MRIIEPKKSKKKLIKASFLLKLLFVTMAAASLILWFKPARSTAPINKNNPQQAPSDPETQKTSQQPTKLKVLSGEQFRQLYESVSYPNTQFITDNLPISGNPEADKRIRQLAESRGYKKRSIPVSPIVKIGDPNLSGDDLLQQKAIDGWRVLQANAKQAGLDLRILSGYRSPELQRTIFLSRFKAYGVSYEQVAAGNGDAAVNDLLESTSVPGYSRHHTGYTVDFQCGNGSLEAFESSVCYQWVSANNFEQAKKAGFIPSYPAGVTNQGPDPEPWEFVWVGTAVLYE